MKTKRLYALTTTLTGPMAAGETYTWKGYTWTVPDDGVVMFYIGETTMTYEERLSKHRTYARKKMLHEAGQAVQGLHDYPVYDFTFTWCNGLDFEMVPLQEGDAFPGFTEAQWLEQAKGLGHPIMNKAGASTSLERKPAQKDETGCFIKTAKVPDVDEAECRRLRAEWEEKRRHDRERLAELEAKYGRGR